MSEQNIPVKMGLRASTVKQVRKLKDAFKAGNEADAVRTAIEMADDVVSTIQKGGSVIMEHSDGTTTKIVIPGLKR